MKLTKKEILTALIVFIGFASISSLAIYASGVTINIWDKGYRVDSGSSIGVTDLSYDKGAYGQGYKITNNSGAAQFFPTRTKEEWDSLKAHTPSGVVIKSINDGCYWDGEIVQNNNVIRVWNTKTNFSTDSYPCNEFWKSNYAKCVNGNLIKFSNDGSYSNTAGWQSYQVISDFPFLNCTIIPNHGINKLKAYFEINDINKGTSTITYSDGQTVVQGNDLFPSSIITSCSTVGSKIVRLKARCELGSPYTDDTVDNNWGTMDRVDNTSLFGSDTGCLIDGNDVANGNIPDSVYKNKSQLNIKCRTGWSSQGTNGLCRIDVEAECEY